MSFDLRLGGAWRAIRLPIVLVVALVAANVVGYFGWTRPRWAAASVTSAAVQDVQRARATVDPALQRARLSYGRILGAEAELEQLRDRVGRASGTTADVVSTLRSAIDAAGLENDRIGYQPQPANELALVQLQIDAPVRGSYSSIRRVLHDLLTGPSFMLVERVALSTPPQGQAAGILQLQLSLTAFIDPAYARASELPEDPVVIDTSAEVNDELTGPSTVNGSTPAALGDGGGDNPVDAASALATAQRLRDELAELPTIPVEAGIFDLDLDRLDTLAGASEVLASNRNLFAFGATVIAQAQRQRAAEAERESRARDDRRRGDSAPSPVMPHTLVGVVRTDGLFYATLVDETQVHVVIAGDLLPDGYRVTEVGMIHAVLEAGGLRTRLSLRKEEKEQTVNTFDEARTRGNTEKANKKRKSQ